MTSLGVPNGTREWAVQASADDVIWNRHGDTGMKITSVTSGVETTEWCLTFHLVMALRLGKSAVGAVVQMTHQSIAENVQGPLRSARSILRRHTASGTTGHGAEAKNDDLGEMADTDGVCL
jgi:hypothetical protein